MADKKRYHLIGIGGAGMSAIAYILHAEGFSVSGSDRTESEVTVRLQNEGVVVNIGHSAENVDGADIVVYSAAIPQTNCEMVRAKELGLCIYERPEMLGILMKSYKNRVAVAGTHGKTTTTSMIASIFEKSGVNTTDLIGGDLAMMGGNAKLGSSDIFITEACEAFGSFWQLYPSLAVVTNMDADHLDFYGDYAGVEKGFLRFVSNVDDDGIVVMCRDDKNSVCASEKMSRDILWIGTDESCDVWAKEIDINSPTPSYTLVARGAEQCRITLCVPGMHNIYNSLAAVAVTHRLGVGFDDIKDALVSFRGAGRRFDVIHNKKVMVVDDYAHHPSEIMTTLTGIKNAYDRKIKVVFQPHLYSRTKAHCDMFAQALSIADEVTLIPIYAAREKPIEGVTGKIIADRIDGARYVESMDEATEIAAKEAREGDIIISMGAGSVTQLGHALAKILDGMGL